MEPLRPKRADFVYSYVKDAILDGVYDAQQWLPIDRIAAELEVSRQPVMDSMKRLAVEGFVSVVPQVGCRLRVYEPTQVEDFFRLFAEGEALVGELAARRADAEDIAELQLISDGIGRLVSSRVSDQQRSRTYRRLNRALHLRLRHAARSPAVAEIVESLGDRSDFFIAQAQRPIFAARLKEAHSEHEALLAAIAAGDACSARTIIQAHILAIGARLRVPDATSVRPTMALPENPAGDIEKHRDGV